MKLVTTLSSLRTTFFIVVAFSFSSHLNAQIVINEYSCSNLNTSVDNFGGYEDWVELYNTTASPVNLNGYYLSDKLINPTKWQIGNATINANGFLRIWASGRNINTGTNIHAGFKLTQCKPEEIVLANATGTVIDSQTLVSTQVGHSRGRTTNGAATWSVFTTPTPGASNANPFQNYATTPSMSIAAGFYTSTQNVTISTPDPNITIYYTTNGTTPTTASTVYSTPIAVSTTKVIRARAYSSTATIPASFIESNTFFINANHKVEVVSVFGDQITNWLTTGNPTNLKAAGGLEYFDKLGALQAESFGEINKHGNDSWSYPQRGIDFKCVDQYGYNDALKYQIFNSKPRAEFQRIILKASAGDNYPYETPGNPYSWGPNSQLGGAHIRDQYVQTLAQKAGLHLDVRTWAPSVLYVNGSYWGVYDSREKVDDADFTDYYFNSDSQFSNSPDQDSLQFLKDWGGVWAEYGGNTALNDWAALRAYVAANNMAVQANYNYVDSLLNIKSFVDYFFINTVCVSKDWLNWNTAWWRGLNVKGKKKKWRYTLWDVDATFDHYVNYSGVPSSGANADPCQTQSLNPPGGDEGHLKILNALLANPGFKQYYVMRYFDLMNNGLSCTRMITILDSMVNVIDPEMTAHITRWNANGGNGTYTKWRANVTDLRNFILARCANVVNNFAPCNGTTGPYPIKLNVSPAGSGTVDLNSLNITQFTYSGIYPGGININLVAHAKPGYCFDHWEFQSHTPTPSTTDSAVSVGLTKTDSIIAHFTIGGSASVTASATTIFCGDSAQLQVTGGSSFIWTPAVGLSSTSISNPVATPTVTTTYTVFTSGQCGSDTTSITINVSGSASASVTASSTAIPCGGSTTLLAAGGSSYLWSPPTGLSNTTIPNPVASPTTNITYTVIVTSPCGTDTTSIAISINGGNNASITASSNNVCLGSSATLVASVSTSYSWSPATGLSNPSISNPVATPTISTTYSVAVSDACGSDTALVTITVSKLPVPNVSGDVTICNTENAELSASGGANYIWSPPTGLSCVSCANPIASPPATTTYYLIVTDAKNCSASDTVTVFVSGECPEIFVPTGFSPNGDGNNDMLFVFGTMSELEFVIYNRWGQVVFKTNDKLIGWDGKHNGKLVQSGVYAYKFYALDSKGVSVKKAGNITVVW